MSFKESKVHRGSCEFRRYVVIVYRASVIERLYKTTKKVGAVKVTTWSNFATFLAKQTIIRRAKQQTLLYVFTVHLLSIL
jgi:hypothetical protein